MRVRSIGGHNARAAHQVQALEARKLSAAESLQQGQQLRLAELLIREVDVLAIVSQQITAHAHAGHVARQVTQKGVRRRCI
jgi:hypothetical protein